MPTNVDVHILYAIVLYRLDNLNEAETELARVLSLPLSDDLRAELSDYLSEIKRRKRRDNFVITTQNAYVYDTNRNSSPSSNALDTQFGRVRLFGSDRAVPNSSYQGQLRVDWEHDLGFQRQHRLVSSLRAVHSDQARLDELTLSGLDGRTGLVLDFNPYTIEPYVTSSYALLSHQLYYRSVGGGLRASALFSNKVSVSLFGTAVAQKYDGLSEAPDERQRSGAEYRAGLSVSYALRADMRITVSSIFVRKTAIADFFRFTGTRLRVEHEYLLGRGMFLLSQFAWEYEQYDGPKLTESAMRRRQHRFRGGTTLGVPLSLILPFKQVLGVTRRTTLVAGVDYTREFVEHHQLHEQQLAFHDWLHHPRGAMTAMRRGGPIKVVVLAIAVAAAGMVMVDARPARAKIGDKAGVAGAVRGTVNQASYSSTKPTIGRKVASGDPIYLGDRIKTGSKSGLQIMLLDQTTFTIGPDAEMAIDKFVYDPKSRSGNMSARILKGTFRFVSGTIERNNPAGVVIKTPVATIGVRGTTVIGHTNGRSLTVILAGPGRRNNVGRPASRIIITAGGRRVVIFRAGFGTFIARLGAGPSRPRRYSLRALARLLHDLFSRPGSQETNSLDQIAPGAGPGSNSFANFFQNFTGQGTQQGSTNANQQSTVNTFWISLSDQSNDNSTDNSTTQNDRKHRQHRRHRVVRGVGILRWLGHGHHHRTLVIFLRVGGQGHHGHSRLLKLTVVRILVGGHFGRPARLLVSYRLPGRHRTQFAIVTIGRSLGHYSSFRLTLSQFGFRYHRLIGGHYRYARRWRHGRHHRFSRRWHHSRHHARHHRRRSHRISFRFRNRHFRHHNFHLPHHH